MRCRKRGRDDDVADKVDISDTKRPRGRSKEAKGGIKGGKLY